MDLILSKTINGFIKFVKKNRPDLIIVDGDRVESLACAIVGSINNINLNEDNIKSEEFRASAIMEGYNKIGCDAINVGKYELLNGLSFLKNMSKKTNIPFLSANLKNSKTN